MSDEFRYVTYPDAKVFDAAGNQVDHLLFGDWVRVEGPENAGMLPVRARGTDGFMRVGDLQEQRVLEIVFVDVGQGDGALVITPDDRHLVVDAGEHDNMHRFLRWRYNLLRKRWTFDAAVITHPDQDHYRGFAPLFEDPNVEFACVYHNGIIETASSQAPLGAMTTSGSPRYLTELMEAQPDLEAFLGNASRWTTQTGGQKQYPKLLQSALGRVPAGGNRVRMLSTDADHSENGFLPGFGAGQPVRIRVLGPVVERVAGQKRLRTFGDEVGSNAFDAGKTKNGQSVLLMLEYGRVRVLLGGDLNSPAECFLLGHYTGLPAPAADANGERQLIDAARPIFGADVVKCCHHGSADFTDAFLSAVHPAATVVSSGDEESHAHPRCDTLGAVGLHGRGWRPLIFSTELARSTREDEGEKRVEVGRLLERIEHTPAGPARDALIAKRDALLDELGKRNVTIFGAINLRTDGERIVMAYKLEKPRKGNAGGRRTHTEWDLYRLERSGTGPITFREPG